MKARRWFLCLTLISFGLLALLVTRTRPVSAQGAATSARTVVSDWYPTELGDTWTYQHESRDGGNTGGLANPAVERWTTEETIVNTTRVPDGTIVTEQAKVLDHEMLKGWSPQNDHTKRVPSRSVFLVRQNCLYELHETAREEPIAPGFCFPMAIGMTWGRVPRTSLAEENVWHVTTVNGDPFGVNGGTTFHMFAYVGAGEVADRWFEQGVGVLQEISEHHGTYDEDRRQLLSTTLHGKTQRYRLTPARTVPWSGRPDCIGIGWQHFVRADGHPFENQTACASYVLPATYLAR